MKLVSVIILNYNKKDYLVTCLVSVMKQIYKNIEIIITDNGSSDGSQTIVREYCPSVKLIENKDTDYFNCCRARNKGIKLSKGEYILSLDNDTILESNFVEEMIKAIELHEKIGMVSGKILLMDKKTIYSTGIFPSRSRRATERGNGECDIGQYEKLEYIFGPTGAVSFFKRGMLEDIKINDEYFDERAPWGYDDLDLCWRANLYGWKGLYAPTAIAYHIKGGTIKIKNAKLKFFKKYYFTQIPDWAKINLVKGKYLTLIKNDSLRSIIINLPHILLHEFKLWSYIILFEPQLTWGIIKNIKDFKIAFGKRQIIKKLKKIKTIYGG